MDRTTEAWLEGSNAASCRFHDDRSRSGARALSSCYVERRTKLATGAALSSASGRHSPRFLARCISSSRARLSRRGDLPSSITDVIDLGCGTAAAGAGLAARSRRARFAGLTVIRGRSPRRMTYRQFGLRHRVVQASMVRRLDWGFQLRARRGTVPATSPSTNWRQSLAPRVASLRAAVRRRR